MKNLIKIAITLTAIGVAVKVVEHQQKILEMKIKNVEELSNLALEILENN